MSDPILPLEVWEEGTLQNDVPANTNSLRIEAMRRPVEAIANSPSVTDDGTVYIVGAAPSGAFATFDPDDLTIYRGGTWYAWAPTEGLEANGYQYTGSGGWVDGGGGGSGTVTSVGFTANASIADVFSVSGSPVTSSGAFDLSADDPGADRILFWDDSDSKLTHLTVGTGLSITGTTLAATGGGGLTNWTDGLNSSSPNATVPVASLSATNAATNVDAAIVPKGMGAFSLHIADNLTAGGNKRGANAIDLQTVRSTNAQVASGARSFAAGWNNTSSAQGSVAIGGGNSASAEAAVALGASNSASGTNSAAIGGTGGAASGTGSVALGGGTANASGAHSFGAGANSNSVVGAFSESYLGQPPRARYSLHGFTSNATPLTLTTNGSAAAATNQVYFGNLNNRSGIYRGLIVARQTGNGGAKMSWEFVAHLDRDNGTLTLVGSVTPAVVAASSGPPAWTVAVTANDTLKTLKIEVTGVAATNINWACFVDGQEVAGT